MLNLLKAYRCLRSLGGSNVCEFGSMLRSSLFIHYAVYNYPMYSVQFCALQLSSVYNKFQCNWCIVTPIITMYTKFNQPLARWIMRPIHAGLVYVTKPDECFLRRFPTAAYQLALRNSITLQLTSSVEPIRISTEQIKYDIKSDLKKKKKKEIFCSIFSIKKCDDARSNNT